MIVILKASCPVDAEDFAEVAANEFLGDARRKPQRSLRFWFVLFGLTLLAACQTASSQPPAPQPVSARTLTKEYQESTAEARRKYDGKEITVTGHTVMTAMMPPSGSDQGLIFLEEKGANPPRRVSCWFSKDQSEQFSKIKAGQLITVKGIFNGEAGAELKFCKLVKIEIEKFYRTASRSERVKERNLGITTSTILEPRAVASGLRIQEGFKRRRREIFVATARQERLKLL